MRDVSWGLVLELENGFGFAASVVAAGLPRPFSITHHASRLLYASLSRGLAPSSCSPASSAGSPCSFSRADSAASLAFMAPTKSPVKRPPLKSVLRKNSQVCGQPAVPLVRAVSQPARLFVYSGLWNGLKS